MGLHVLVRIAASDARLDDAALAAVGTRGGLTRSLNASAPDVAIFVHTASAAVVGDERGLVWLQTVRTLASSSGVP